MAKVKIEPQPNAAYKVTGEVDLYDAQGNKLPTKRGEAIWLCRCGGSKNKPFCDGTHSKIGFKADR